MQKAPKDGKFRAIYYMSKKTFPQKYSDSKSQRITPFELFLDVKVTIK